MQSESNTLGKVLAILLAVVLIVGGIWFFTREDTADETTETETTQMDTEEQAEPSMNIVELAAANPDLSTLVAAVQEAELVDTLSGPGPFTVFAPTNEAFENLLNELDITAEELLARDDLGSILTFHVIPSAVLSSDLSEEQTVTTVNGEELTITVRNGEVMINGSAMVTTADVQASNGVVHIIDSVLIP